jgi:hypothetical protein
MDVLGTRLIVYLLDFEYKTGFHRTISFVCRYETKRFDQVLFYENHFQSAVSGGVPTGSKS